MAVVLLTLVPLILTLRHCVDPAQTAGGVSEVRLTTRPGQQPGGQTCRGMSRFAARAGPYFPVALCLPGAHRPDRRSACPTSAFQHDDGDSTPIILCSWIFLPSIPSCPATSMTSPGAGDQDTAQRRKTLLCCGRSFSASASNTAPPRASLAAMTYPRTSPALPPPSPRPANGTAFCRSDPRRSLGDLSRDGCRRRSRRCIGSPTQPLD